MRPRIFGYTIREARTLLLATVLGMIALEAIVASTYKDFGGMASSVLEQLPREWAALLKLQPGLPLGGNVSSYLALGYYHPLFLILGSVTAITLGARSLAGEIDRQTILYLLACPLPRWHMVVSKALALIPVTLLVSLGAVTGTCIGVTLAGIEADLSHIAVNGINAWALFLAIGGIALLASSAAHSTGQAAGWVTGFVLISFFVDFLSDLWEPIRTLEPFSLFDHYDPSETIASGRLDVTDVTLLLGVALAAVVAAVLVFSRRDIA